jgi:hypothetical protein
MVSFHSDTKRQHYMLKFYSTDVSVSNSNILFLRVLKCLIVDISLTKHNTSDALHWTLEFK